MSHEVLLMGYRASYFNLETKVLGKTHKRASRLSLGLARCLLSCCLQNQGMPSSVHLVRGQVPFSRRQWDG